MTDYDDEGYEIEYDHEGDRADRLYDEMRDDFLAIQNEAGAIACIVRYPSMAGRYLPEEYKHLLKENR